MNSDELPDTWELVQLGEVSRIRSGVGFPKEMQNRQNGRYPVFKVGDISEAWKAGRPRLSRSEHTLSEEEAAQLRAKPMGPETTVFAKIGAAIALNRRAMLGVEAVCDNNVMGLEPQISVLEPKYLFNFMCTVQLGDIARATAVPSVRSTDVSVINIPLPPLPEQLRIVEAIESQLTRLEAAVAALKRAQANLKRYRASVLTAAVEGRLVPTEAELARREGREYESGEHPSALPSIPDCWHWDTLGDHLEKIEAGKSFKCEERRPSTDEVGVAKVSAVTWGEYNERESKTCLEAERVNSSLFVAPGDFLFSRANTIDLVGACVIANRVTQTVMLSDKILRFRLKGIEPRWALICLRSRWGRFEIERLSTGNQESMRNIGQDRIRRIRIPVPPLDQQQLVVEAVEQRWSVLEAQARIIEANLVRAERLRQSILKRAFEGKLVPQDPSDESPNLA